MTSVKDVIKLLKKGNENRSTAATEMNAHSSRSHMVLSVSVSCGVTREDPTKGTLYLVDLAGSERARESGVERANLKGVTGNVMEALDRKASHIPHPVIVSSLTFFKIVVEGTREQ